MARFDGQVVLVSGAASGIGRPWPTDDADLALLSRSTSPMGRLIDPAEVAGAVGYLASPDAASVSGTTLVIDGATTA